MRTSPCACKKLRRPRHNKDNRRMPPHSYYQIIVAITRKLAVLIYLSIGTSSGSRHHMTRSFRWRKAEPTKRETWTFTRFEGNDSFDVIVEQNDCGLNFARVMSNSHSNLHFSPPPSGQKFKNDLESLQISAQPFSGRLHVLSCG